MDVYTQIAEVRLYLLFFMQSSGLYLVSHSSCPARTDDRIAGCIPVSFKASYMMQTALSASQTALPVQAYGQCSCTHVCLKKFKIPLVKAFVVEI